MSSRPQPQSYITRNGWRITYTPNIHMYVHGLAAAKEGTELAVPCESTPEGFVGIWPYQMDLDAALSRDLLVALREWAAQSRLDYRLYTTQTTYENGLQPASHMMKFLLIVLLLSKRCTNVYTVLFLPRAVLLTVLVSGRRHFPACSWNRSSCSATRYRLARHG